MDPKNLRLLKGHCNQCGLCCFTAGMRCINLIITDTPGQPMATKCALWSTRFNGMHIFFIRPDSTIGGEGRCEVESLQGDVNIIERGIGNGCSLEIAPHGG